MKKPKFKYDTRLKEKELTFFEDLIGKSISVFRVENASISPPPNFHISNIGRCSISFYSRDAGPYATIELTSLFQETPPVVDSGGIAIKKTYESIIPLETKKNLGLKQEWSPAASIKYSDQSAIESFKFYGSKERRGLKEIDPDLDLEWLGIWGFKDFPELEVDTIEFVIIEHESKKKTVISTDSDGFWYQFLIDKPIDDELLYNSYMKVNGYEKNIVLHHEIKKKE